MKDTPRNKWIFPVLWLVAGLSAAMIAGWWGVALIAFSIMYWLYVAE